MRSWKTVAKMSVFEDSWAEVQITAQSKLKLKKKINNKTKKKKKLKLFTASVPQKTSLKEWSEAKVAQWCLTLCDPMDYTAHGVLQARILEWVAFPFSRGNLPNPGIGPKSPRLQADSFPAKPLGKAKNTGVGSLSLLQRIFPTQGLNPGLPHCSWII